jgi:pimeloyl-ACP methyl ester carboxylesterase
VEAGLAALRDRPDATSVLESIRVPCELVCGELDALTPPDVMEQLARAIPGARLTTLPGAGHLSNLEAPEPFNRVLLGLLERVP